MPQVRVSEGIRYGFSHIAYLVALAFVLVVGVILGALIIFVSLRPEFNPFFSSWA